ncbi:hypothetical protein T01_12405 [Trichinella spiralis]|uniref:Uncharacterized protein n=1 Tax=Trichinella spiralis TaxID=6334 RepID=A0A0V1ALB6_TRISP|nr:hypothetical protein T01_12405 [Trichinella spiralis]
MREKLRDGGGGSCHMRSSTQSPQNRGICISQCYWRYNNITETLRSHFKNEGNVTAILKVSKVVV